MSPGSPEAARRRPKAPRTADTHDGTVVEVHGMRATVLLHATQRRQRCRPLRDRTQLAVGDRVVATEGAHGWDITELKPRERSLWRPVERGKRIMATHVDRVMIVGAIVPELRPGFFDRLLVATDAEDIEAVLVVNKVDLGGYALEDAREAIAPFAALGYEVLEVSARSGEGVERLRAHAAHGLSVFVGHSGVGKSSLLNLLKPGIQLMTGDVNAITSKGRHTTTVTTCHPLGAPWPEGALLVDTPGVRTFGLYGLELVDLAYGFRELRPFRVDCHFRDCLHESEPGCAVIEAVDREDVDPDRYDRYLRILDSVRAGEG